MTYARNFGEIGGAGARDVARYVALSGMLLYRASATGLVHVLRNSESLREAARPRGAGESHTTPTIWRFLRIVRQRCRHRRLATA